MAISAPAQRPTSQQSPLSPQKQKGVPRLTVVTLAVVMAYADGFWMTSLRGATGAIARTQAPFATWLRESTLVLPVFAFAVLGALTLGLHLFGPVLRRSREVLAAALLVVVGGTVAGVVELAASCAYDYHLQLGQLRLMDSMRGTNVASSLSQQQQATLGLQVHAVAAGAVILLVTNLILVGWVVAIRGGRLSLSTTQPLARTSETSAADSRHRSRVNDLRLLLAAGLTASAVIHLAVIPEHFTEWAAAAVFFIALVAAELAIAALLLLTRPHPTILSAAVAVSLGPLALWTYSRTVGMPFGPGSGVPEPIGLPDLASCTLELSTLFIAVVLLRRTTWIQRPAMSAHIRWLALTAVIATITIGLAGSSLALFNDFPNPGDQTLMTTTH